MVFELFSLTGLLNLEIWNVYHQDFSRVPKRIMTCFLIKDEHFFSFNNFVPFKFLFQNVFTT